MASLRFRSFTEAPLPFLVLLCACKAGEVVGEAHDASPYANCQASVEDRVETTSTARYITQTYDDSGFLVFAEYGSTPDTYDYSVSFTNDDRGNVLFMETVFYGTGDPSAFGSSCEASYDEHGHLVTERCDYAMYGEWHTSMDYTYDNFHDADVLVRSIRASHLGSVRYTFVDYTYDDAGHPTRVDYDYGLDASLDSFEVLAYDGDLLIQKETTDGVQSDPTLSTERWDHDELERVARDTRDVDGERFSDLLYTYSCD